MRAGDPAGRTLPTDAQVHAAIEALVAGDLRRETRWQIVRAALIAAQDAAPAAKDDPPAARGRKA